MVTWPSTHGGNASTHNMLLMSNLHCMGLTKSCKIIYVRTTRLLHVVNKIILHPWTLEERSHVAFAILWLHI